MADVKWIKITTDIFDDEKIKIIDTMPARDEILVIWFKLLSLAGRTNQGGALRMNSKIPYTNEMLAAVFNRNLNMVKLSLNIFQNYGMIEVEENETISIVNWDKHQNIEGLDKIRIQNKLRQQTARDKKKTLLIEATTEICAYCGNSSNTVDHIIPRSKSGKDISANIVACCKPCNSSKGNKDLSVFLNDSITLSHQNINFELVKKNNKLMSFVTFDGGLFKTSRDNNVTVTQDNATELELELELDKEKDIPIKEIAEKIPYKEIITYLNEQANKNFKFTGSANKDLIKARFNDGFTLEEFTKVIDIKCEEWIGDTKMEKFLQPSTLFSNKFDNYLNQEIIVKGKKTNTWGNIDA